MRRVIPPALAVAVVVLLEAPAVATISSSPTPGVWGTNGRIRAVLQVGSVTYVGGSFTEAISPDGMQTLPRANLMALDANGVPTSWNPGANNLVLALASDGTYIYVGGKFTDIGKRVAKISTAGVVQPFAIANDEVRSLAIVGSRLYAAGDFTKIAGVYRSYLAALSTTNGSFDSTFAPSVDGFVYGAKPFSNGNLLIGGLFTHVDGSSTGTAAIVTPTGTLGPALFSPPTDKVLTVSTSGSQGVLGVAGIGNAAIAYANTGSQLWRVECNGDVQAATFANAQWIIGGHFGTCLGLSARKIAAITAGGSLDTSWRPNVKGTHGIWTLGATSSTLYAGGDFDQVNSQLTPHLAKWAIT